MSKQDNNTETALEQQDQAGNSLTKRESNVGFSLEPKNLQEAMKICDYLASSSMVPKQYQGNPADILVAINFGQEVGLKPLQSLNSVAVVNGSPSLWGDAPLAMVKQHPDFQFILEDNEAFAYARDEVKGWGHLKDVDKDDTSICVVKREGEPPTVREFSKQDVKQAGLGNVHKSYPKIMRRYRARSQALKATFPDVLKGFEQAEIQKETEQMIEEGHYEDYTDVTQYSKQDQPTADEREDVDIDATDTEEPDKQNGSVETQPDSTNGSQQAEQSTDQEEYDRVLANINNAGKEYWGTKWFKKSKEFLPEGAEYLTDLNIDQLREVKAKIEAKSKAEA